MPLKIFALIISLVSWILSYVIYQYYKMLLNLPDEWYFHLTILFGIGILNSIILFFVKKNSYSLVVFSFKALLFLLICFPLGNFILIQTILITGIIIEAVFYFRFKINLFLTNLMILLAFLISNNQHLIWNVYTTRIEWINLLIFIIYSFFINILFSLIKFYNIKIIEKDEDVKRLNLMISILEKTNIKYQEDAIYSGEKSKTEERKRIARDIHDIIGYSMTNIKMMVEAAITMVPKKLKELKQLLQDIKIQTNEGFDEIICTVRSMYRMPPNKKTGIPAIQSLIRSFVQAAKVKVKTEFSNMPNSCGEELDQIIYHIVQEGIINSFRHGGADKIRISFWKESDSIKIYIWDNGKGSTKNNLMNQGIGLEGIKDRIVAIGGTFNSCNVINGYEVNAVLPYKGDDSDENQSLIG